MVSLSKEEITSYLLDYCILFSKMRNCPNKKINRLYDEIMLEKYRSGININSYNENSYMIMLRVYSIINYLKLFSYYEECFFDSIDDRNLDFVEFKKNVKDGGIFVDGDGKGFSNKQIILYIRNAFNHNDDPNHSKFNISKNGKYIEVNLLDVRTDEQKIKQPDNKKSFHIKISYNDFLHLFKIMSEEIQNYFISFYTSLSLEERPDVITDEFINGISLNRILLQKKISLEILKLLKEICFNHMLSKEEKLSQIYDILSKNEINFKVEQYELDDCQKNALKMAFANEYKSDPGVLDFVFGSFVNNYTPLGMSKTTDIRNEIILLNFMSKLDISYKDIEMSVYKIIKNKIVSMNEIEKNIASGFSFDVGNLIRLNNTFNVYMKRSAFITYISYVIGNCYKEDEVITNDITREHMRNSLTHGWFFINLDNILELYDNNNRKKDNYNFYWHKSVSFVDLLNTIVSRSNSKIKAGIVRKKELK